jgi:uncharacterized membrane protein YraQ (UPF0718 family)
MASDERSSETVNFMTLIMTFLTEIWVVTVAMAPYLLFGFLMAGVLSELISRDYVRRHLGGRRWIQSFKAALFGVPMPICSCGVIPLAASLRDMGASRGATASFLASTPQTGVDSLMVTYALLGLPFAIFRALAAFVSGLIAGSAVEFVATKEEREQSQFTEAPKQQHNGLGPMLRRMFTYGFITLPCNISGAMIFGIVLSGIISSLVPDNYFADIGGGTFTLMLLMLVIGIPLYVCSSASVPIALAFIKAGIDPGAALVFLITGPATNAATLTTLGKILGRKQLFAFLSAIIVTAIGSGLILNQIPLQLDCTVYACGCVEGTETMQLVPALLLLVVLLSGAAYDKLPIGKKKSTCSK